MATYSPKQYAAHLNNNLLRFQNSKTEFQLAVYETLRMADKRIFDQGKDGNGGNIGSYSTKPMLATKSQFRMASKFKPTIAKSSIGFATNIKTKKVKTVKVKGAKNSPSSWLWIKFPKAKKAVPVMILEGGYKQFKGLNNLESGFVNLQFNKFFRRAFLTRAFPISINGTLIQVDIGIPPSKVNPIGKLKGLMIDKYPRAFKFTKMEKAFLLNEIKQIFLDELRA